jgi:probable HAF family extracellular repeat protein
MYPTLNSLTLAGGQSGMVNVCVVPTDTTGFSMPPVGQSQNYSVKVTSATNPTVTASAQPSFIAPPIPSLDASLNPSSVATAPGGTVSVNLSLGSLGNVAPGAVTLTAVAPTGIAVNGLTSPLNVPLNGTVTEALSITAAANLAGSYSITILASFTPAGGTAQFDYLPITVLVTPLGACAVSSAAVATQVGKTSLAADLGALAAEMDAAAAAPANAVFVSQATGTMNTILNQELTATYFQSIVPNLTTATNAVASATAATLPNALGNLSAALCAIGTLLNQANTANTGLSLRPYYTLTDTNLAVGPNQSAQWNVAIANNSTVIHVYDLSITGVPSGVTVQFSQPSITLPPAPSPYNSSSSILLTLTTGPAFNTPFSFTVVATPEDAPDFAVSAAGTLLARTESVNVDQITAAPAYADAGTPVTISARIFSVVNETVGAQLQLTVTDPAGHAVCCSQTASFSLTPSTSIQTVTFPALDTTSFVNGLYSVSAVAESGGIAQGAAAMGSFLIGSPLSGVLTAAPSVVAPGSSTVQVSLAINRDSVSNPVSTLVGTVPVNGVPRAMALYRNGAQQLAYVCSDSQVNIVDVTNTASPLVLSTFANDILTTESGYPNDPSNGVVTGYQGVSCAVYNNTLLISYSRFDGNSTFSAIPTHFATYSLANPLSPVQVGSVVDIPRDDSEGLYVAGNTALMFQGTTVFSQFNSFISAEIGDIWTANLSTPGSVSFQNDIYNCGGINSSTHACNNVTSVPTGTESGGVCTLTGTTPVPNDPTRGGPYAIGPGAPVNSTTSYFASTNASGVNIENPSCPQISGQLLVVDTTNPATPAILSQVSSPAMAFMTAVAVQGSTALAVGDSKGIYDIKSGYTGTLVLSSFDITDPTDPQLKNSVTTQLADSAGSFVVPLGSNTFAVGNTTLNGKAELVLVDASSPSALRYVPYDAAFVANPTVAQNGYFFALSATPASTQNALSIFQLSQITGPQLSVSLQIPTTGNAALVPGSFNPAPSTTTPGSGSTTYTWNQPSQNTITFGMNLTGVNPGDVTTLVNSGSLNYTLPSLGSGSYSLGSLSVLSHHILSISPQSQTVSYGGAPETYTATVTNPTGTQQTFNLSAIVPPGWSGVVPANVTVAANGSQNFNVAIAPPANIQTNSYTFNVAANSAGGISDTVPAVLAINEGGANLGNNGNTSVTAFTSAIAPSQVTVGQGDSSAPFAVTFTNTGNYNTYIQANGALNLPAGVFVGSYSPTYFATLSPNASDSIMGTASANRGTTPGTYPVTIPIQAGNSLVENLSLTVTVSSAGIQGSISPTTGTTAGNFKLTVTNTGLSQDTFALSVVGPLAQAASIQPTVTLAAGATSQAIPIVFDTANYIVPSNAQLTILAVSQKDPGVQALIAATVTVGQTKSVTAAIVPTTISVSSPSAANLLVQAVNTGNVADSYSAQITGITGPVTAALVSNGQSTQSIGEVYTPALGTVQFPLNAIVTGEAPSSVTVTVTSLSDAAISASATVTINAPNACDVNTDGAVNVSDIQLMIDQALGNGEALDDLNLDGILNVVDVQIDIDAALNLGCSASVPGTQSRFVRSQSAKSRILSAAATRGAGAAAIALSDHVTDLGTLGGSSTTAHGINRLGQVVGQSDTGHLSGPGSSRAFLWEAGQMTDLDLAGATNERDSVAYAIDDSGQAAGAFTYADKHTESFRYAGGAATPLRNMPRSQVSAVNNVGQVAGTFVSGVTSSRAEAFLWNAGTLIGLGALGGAGSQAYGINDLGQVVGSSGVGSGSAVHAFLYSGAALADLGTLGGTNSVAYAINNSGQIVGSSQTADDASGHAFLYSAGAMTDLGTLGGADSQADGINGNGLIVGWARTANGERHAFLWNAGQMMDLNSVVSLGGHAVLVEAAAINDAGQIVANGSNGRAYLIALAARR